MEPWQFLPNPWRRQLEGLSISLVRSLEEVRFRVGRPVYLYGQDWTKPLSSEAVDSKEMERVLSILVEHSLYARVDQLSQGFITLPGGHRVGIAGQAVMDHGRVHTVRNIGGLNIRFARAVIGIGDQVLAALSQAGCSGRSLLIVSAPRCGKTTVLRDLVRIMSNQGQRTVIIDERSEIAGLGGSGIPTYDLGLHTDVLDGWPKPEGLAIALRTLGPDLVAVDELGPSADYRGIFKARFSGVDVMATVHAENIREMMARREIFKLMKHQALDAVVLLSRRNGPATIEGVYGSEEFPQILDGFGNR